MSKLPIQIEPEDVLGSIREEWYADGIGKRGLVEFETAKYGSELWACLVLCIPVELYIEQLPGTRGLLGYVTNVQSWPGKVRARLDIIEELHIPREWQNAVG